MDCRNEKGSGAMKKLFLPFVAVAALAVGAAPAAPASTATVQIKRSSFLPSTVTIKGTAWKYTHDPNFKPKVQPSLMDHYRPQEQDYMAMAPESGLRFDTAFRRRR